MRSIPWCDIHQRKRQPVMQEGEITWECLVCTPTLTEMELVSTPRGMKTRRVKGRCRPCEEARRREALANERRSADHQAPPPIPPTA